MSSNSGTLEQIACAVGTALAAVSDDLLPDRFATFLLELGLDTLVDTSADAVFQQKLSAAIQALQELFAKIDLLDDAFAESADASVRAASDVLATAAAARSSLSLVAIDLQRVDVSAGSLATVLVQRLLEYSVVCQLERTHPALLGVLELLTIVERTSASIGIGPAAHTVLRRRLYLDRLRTLLADPQSLFATGYGWNSQTLEAEWLLQRLGRLLIAIGVWAGDVLNDAYQPILGLDLGGVTVGIQTDRQPPGLAARVTADATRC